MTEERTPIQLNMNFAGGEGNLFKELMDSARFSLFFEERLPSADSEPETVAARRMEFEHFLSCVTDFPCALAFTDADPDFPALDPCTYASCLCSANRDRHLIYVSGRNRDSESTAGLLEHCYSEGFRNIVCVTGQPPNPIPRDFSPMESPELLAVNAARNHPLFAGCTVNPFQYHPLALRSVHAKLLKKLHAGAGFIVTQYGADMAKIQELIWELFRNNLIFPVLPRILFMTPEQAEKICSGHVPGVRLPADMAASIRKEMQFSAKQFEAAQWRRLQLHAAGARFFGCSGLQIGGITTPETAEKAISRIRDTFREFRSYADWLTAYRDYYAHMSMTPYPERYFLFDNLLTETENFDNAKVRKEDYPLPTTGEFFRYNLSHFLFSGAEKADPRERRLTKKLVAGCRSCPQCRLPSCMYVCPRRCPMDLANGICGEVNLDGTCPLSEKKTECIHLLRMRLAIYGMDFSAQEKKIVRHETKRLR